MQTDPGSRRRVALEGCLNFRDLGGYPTTSHRRVRWGALYRSDALHDLTEQDVRTVRDDLGVRLVIDLRSEGEIMSEGIGLLPREPVGYEHVPLLEGIGEVPDRDDLGHRYFRILEQAPAHVAAILERLAHTSHPTVFHCAAGKDRTGMVAAILLGVLGVPDPEIVEDYVLTSYALEGILDRLTQMPSYELLREELPPETLHARPETMESLLARIRKRFGSMRGYARSTGTPEATLRKLEERLVEP